MDAQPGQHQEVDDHDRPEQLPMAAVPWDWTENSPIRITTAIGSTNSAKRGFTTVSPSTAESTDMAG